MIANHGPVLVVLLPLLAGVTIPIVALKRPRLSWALASAAAAAAAAVAASNLIVVVQGGPISYHLGGWPPPWGIEIALDRISAFVAATVAGLAAISILWSRGPLERELGHRTGPFLAVAMIVITGLLGMTVAGDAFNFYVFLEVASLASYALVASNGGAGAFAAIRYLVLGSVGASLYLLGIGYLYAVTGTLNLADLGERLVDAPTPTLAMALVVTGLAMKMGLFPFHAWLPGAYADSPLPAAALLAPVFTKVMVYGLIRFLVTVFVPATPDLVDRLAPVLVAAGAVAILVGAVMAIRQASYRRLLAWSSISQVGYIVVGVGLCHPLALAGALLHILNHGLMKAALFQAGSDHPAGRPTLESLVGLGRRRPVTATVVIIAGLSMVGIPPLGGFFSKWLLLRGALAAGQPVVVASILLGSLLALVYVYRIIRAIGFGGGEERVQESALGELLPTTLIGVVIVLTGFIATPITETLLLRLP